MSAIGWVDFSSEDRDKVRKVLAAAREPGTLDELGIGQIRDAFANTLFPGISTIQTRAKYFVLVPRLLREIETGAVAKGASPMEWLEQQENLIAQLLVTRHGGAETGIIGSESIHSGGVRRHPSSVYWNGLKVLGIVHTNLSLKEFCEQLYSGGHSPDALFRAEEEGLIDRDLQRHLSPLDLPRGQGQWREELSINLTSAEANFLQAKFMEAEAVTDSVMSQILEQGGLSSLLAGTGSEDSHRVELNFDSLTELLVATPGISSRCQDAVTQAQAFGLAIHGAHIRYNCEIAHRNGHSEYVAELEARFAEWQQECMRRKVFMSDCVDNWLVPIASTRISAGTLNFVQDWCHLISQGAALEELDQRVIARAQQTKGARSQLFKKRQEAGWVGIHNLDFRWGVARVLLRDIEEATYA